MEPVNTANRPVTPEQKEEIHTWISTILADLKSLPKTSQEMLHKRGITFLSEDNLAEGTALTGELLHERYGLQIGSGMSVVGDMISTAIVTQELIKKKQEHDTLIDEIASLTTHHATAFKAQNQLLIETLDLRLDRLQAKLWQLKVDSLIDATSGVGSALNVTHTAAALYLTKATLMATTGHLALILGVTSLTLTGAQKLYHYFEHEEISPSIEYKKHFTSNVTCKKLDSFRESMLDGLAYHHQYCEWIAGLSKVDPDFAREIWSTNYHLSEKKFEDLMEWLIH